MMDKYKKIIVNLMELEQISVSPYGLFRNLRDDTECFSKTDFDNLLNSWQIFDGKRLRSKYCFFVTVTYKMFDNYAMKIFSCDGYAINNIDLFNFCMAQYYYAHLKGKDNVYKCKDKFFKCIMDMTINNYFSKEDITTITEYVSNFLIESDKKIWEKIWKQRTLEQALGR